MSETIREYTTRDKTEWMRGEWDNEPDKIQWIDVATGLDCLIVRGPSGALCGYVGVPEGHPYFAVDYSGCTRTPKCEESYCSHSPDVSVHGGLTFSDFCHDASRENWERFRVSARGWEAEAAKYPNGDAARYLRERGHLRDDFDAWAAWMESASICHLPFDGRADRVWWFGFDCAHSGDLCPSYPERLRGLFGGESYKNRRYVEREVADLAAQLARATTHREVTDHAAEDGLEARCGQCTNLEPHTHDV